MRTCRVPAVIIAAVIGGAGLTACAASPANPAAGASPATSGTATAPAATPAATPTSGPSPTPAASPANTHSAAPSAAATATAHPQNSPHATASPSPASSAASTASGTHDFTVPAIPGDNVVAGWGSYTKIGTARVKVTMCAKQTGSAFSVGAIALVYDASGASQNIGATILTGPGNSSCVMTTFILYTAHLKVHAFIGGSNGTIVKTGPVLTIY
jgi:hypothetical protein